MKEAAAATLALSIAAGLSNQSEARQMRLGEVLVLTPVSGQPPVEPGHRLFQADRGGRKGQFVAVRAADGKPPASAGAGSAYQLLHPGTAGTLPDVDVLGIHYLKVRPDRRDAFERFVGEKLHPAVANLRPDLRLLYYKATTGPETGNYIALFALTRESRDKYWPGGADSDTLRAAFKPVQPLTAELLTFLVEGSALTDPKFAAAVFESREWTDFVLVPSK